MKPGLLLFADERKNAERVRNEILLGKFSDERQLEMLIDLRQRRTNSK